MQKTTVQKLHFDTRRVGNLGRTTMLQNPPYEGDVLNRVTAVMKNRTSRVLDGKDMELEARLGTILPNGQFRAGCSKTQMEYLLGKFENAQPGVFELSDWTECCDTFFNVPNVSSQIRATSWGDSCNITYKCVNIIKHRVDTFQISSKSAPSLAWKLCLNAEKPVQGNTLPVLVQPRHVRIKHRKSFTYTTSDGSVTWRYDFTLSWKGNNKEAAELSQCSEDPTYEFEVELVRAHADVSEKYLAESVLAKLCDHVTGLWLPCG